MPPFLLAQLPQAAPVTNPFAPAQNNPNVAMDAILALATQYHVLGTLHMIGVALLALFTLLELYRLWIAGDVQGLPILGVKVLIVNALISVGPGSPVTTTLRTVYGYFAQAGQDLVAAAASVDASAILQALKDLVTTPATMDWWYWMTHWSIVLALLEAVLFAVAYYIVLALLFALYTFAVVSSRLFIVLSIVLIPIIFPLTLWTPLTHSYLGRWVSSTVHALLLPLVGAIALVAGLRMGILYPLGQVATCASQTQNAQAWLQCVSSLTGAFIEGLIGGLAAILLMIAVDGVVRSFIGGDIFVSTLGAMASRFFMRTTPQAAGWLGQLARRPARPAAPAEPLTVIVSHPPTTGLPAPSWRPPSGPPGGGPRGLPSPGGGAIALLPGPRIPQTEP